jgi:1,4-dihydroxy-2-naphthoate octaprenyltransferase
MHSKKRFYLGSEIHEMYLSLETIARMPELKILIMIIILIHIGIMILSTKQAAFIVIGFICIICSISAWKRF